MLINSLVTSYAGRRSLIFRACKEQPGAMLTRLQFVLTERRPLCY